jgi:hypothetical protein
MAVAPGGGFRGLTGYTAGMRFKLMTNTRGEKYWRTLQMFRF